MKEVFLSSGISCLEESVSVWTCPGQVYVPRKPHLPVNEYHIIACGEAGIPHRIEIVEGKSISPKNTGNF